MIFLDYFIMNSASPKVLLLQFGNISNSDLLYIFETHLKKIISMFEENDLILLNRTNIVGY